MAPDSRALWRYRSRLAVLSVLLYIIYVQVLLVAHVDDGETFPQARVVASPPPPEHVLRATPSEEIAAASLPPLPSPSPSAPPPPPPRRAQGKQQQQHGGHHRRGQLKRKRDKKERGTQTRQPRQVLMGSAVLSTLTTAGTSDRYVCATLDWWPNLKCDYERCSWQGASLLAIDLEDPLLVAAARRLAPFVLRLGGSLADFVTYEEADGCAPLPSSTARPAGEASPRAPRGGSRRCMSSCGDFTIDEHKIFGFRDGCLTRSRWDQLAAFCRSVGCEIAFSINALRGRVPDQCATSGGGDGGRSRVPCLA